VSPDGEWIYLGMRTTDNRGLLRVMRAQPLSVYRDISLGSEPAAPNGVALIGNSGLVAVADRQNANVAVVDLATASVVRRIPANWLPDGVIIQGNYGYVANFGNDTVTVFDATTLDVVRTLFVGHEPSLFAGDPATGDVYLSLHGSDQVMRLRDGLVAGFYTGVPEPYGLAFDPASRRLYVANRGVHQTVTVIDTVAGRIVGTIAVGREPFVLGVNPDSGHLFVACGDEVKVYRTLDWALVAAIPVAAGAEEGIAVDSVRDRVYVTSHVSTNLAVIQDAAPPLVLFVSTRDGNGEIYRMLPDGSQQLRLTFTAAVYENEPVGSPDGRWIAYTRPDDTSPGHIWVMSRDGHNPRQLTFGAGYDRSPTWSPDGTRLAFASDRDGNWEIYTIRLADGALTRLTYAGAADQEPNWSWATGRIAFQSDRAGTNPEIFTMAGDGSDIRRLTVNPNGDTSPSWSPSGDRIVFYGSRGEQTLYVMNANGTGILPLVSRTLRPYSPAWGHDGMVEAILFAGYRPGSGYSEIFRVAPDGSGLALLTHNEVDFDYAPGWLPGP